MVNGSAGGKLSSALHILSELDHKMDRTPLLTLEWYNQQTYSIDEISWQLSIVIVALLISNIKFVINYTHVHPQLG